MTKPTAVAVCVSLMAQGAVRWPPCACLMMGYAAGELVTLIFPVQHGDDPARPLDTQDGPPFEVRGAEEAQVVPALSAALPRRHTRCPLPPCQVNTHLYKQLLLAEGFECTYMEVSAQL